MVTHYVLSADKSELPVVLAVPSFTGINVPHVEGPIGCGH